MKPFLFLMGGVLACGAIIHAQTNVTKTTNFAPLDYFNESCARCHGDYGSFYGADFAKGKTDEQLAGVVKEMCEGPAQAPLSPSDLAVLVAWHRALRDGKPFLAAVKMEGGVLSGEASPGSTVVLHTSNGQRATAPLQEHRWRAGLPEGVQIARIEVKRDGKITRLDPKAAAYAPE